MSFDELKAKYDVPQKHFFKYLQLRSFILTCLKNSVHHSQCLHWTQLYDIMVENHKENSGSKRQQWIGDLQEDILVEDWGTICSKVHTQTINTQLRLIQYNWIMRMYITPVKLNKFDPNMPDRCYKCNIHQGTLHHCLWKCEEIQHFWSSVLQCISQITSSPVSRQLVSV